MGHIMKSSKVTPSGLSRDSKPSASNQQQVAIQISLQAQRWNESKWQRKRGAKGRVGRADFAARSVMNASSLVWRALQITYLAMGMRSQTGQTVVSSRRPRLRNFE